MPRKTVLLFFIILIEGYVVLASELLAIRQLIPFVGSGTETISIVISAVLLPLAVGYHFGGASFRREYARAKRRGKKTLSVRRLLLKNILSALAILALGLSYVFMEIFFAVMTGLGITHRLAQVSVYSMLFLVWPVFLLAQTVPLVSNYFSRRRLSEITGKMLFFSTAGSFMGSVFSTIVLMTFVGVHYTVIFTLGLLTLLGIVLSGRRLIYEPLFCLLVFGFVCLMNSGALMDELNVVSNNAYNMASIVELEDEDARVLSLNRSAASMLSSNPEKGFAYVNYINEHFLKPISDPEGEKRDILIIGAGGFIVGLEDKVNNYVYVDIDKDLKEVSEKHFLKQKLSDNKEFHAASAREFIRRDTRTYDLILIDAYTNVISIPMECTTREFLLDVKKLLKPNGIVISNVISNPGFHDKFTVRYDNTFASVFPAYTRQVMGGITPWTNNPKAVSEQSNILYIYYHHDLVDDDTIYTDDKNTYSLDR